MGTLRDLSDPLAVAAMLGALLAYERGRRWWGAALLTLAVLAREPMIVGVVAVGIDILAGLWRARRDPAARAALVRSWPVVFAPVAAFIGWQIYTRGLIVPPAPTHAAAAVTHAARATHAVAGSDTLALPPFSDFVTEIRRSLTNDAAGPAAWELAYVALLGLGAVSAVWLLRRGLRAATITAVLSAAVLTVIFLGDQWGVSRYGAPLFGALLIAGLGLRSRAALGLCAAAAALTLLVPLVIPGG